MHRFGKLASVVSIAAALFLLCSVPGPASARQGATVLNFDYSGKLGAVRTDIDRVDNHLEILVTMKLDCGKTTRRVQGRVLTKVNPATGKFRYVAPADQRDVSVGAGFTDITGRIAKDGNVKGRVGMVESDHFSANYTCFSGKSLKNLWEPFEAKPVDPGRFTIYTFTSRSDSEHKNGPLKCSSGKSYSDPKVKFKAELVN